MQSRLLGATRVVAGLALALSCSRAPEPISAEDLAAARDVAILAYRADGWLGGPRSYQYFGLGRELIHEWASADELALDAGILREAFPELEPRAIRRFIEQLKASGPAAATPSADPRLRFLDWSSVPGLDPEPVPEDFEDREDFADAYIEWKRERISRGFEHFRAGFPDCAGTFNTSQVVYFPDTGDALVYVRFWCGMLCGEGYVAWVQRDGSSWTLRKTHTLWVS